MTRLDDAIARALESDDPEIALGARLVVEELEDARTARPASYQKRSALPGIDLVDLIERGIPRVPAAQPIYPRGNQVRTGHEPAHGSSSGTCIAIWPEEGRWYCYSCGRGGDALAYIVGLLAGSPTREDWRAAAKILREIAKGTGGSKDQLALDFMEPAAESAPDEEEGKCD